MAVGNNHRFRTDVQAASAFLRSGELGALAAIRGGHYQLKRAAEGWRFRKAESGGGALMEHGLPIIDGHLELPDLRIEYEAPDGTLQHRDVELVTEHYSRAQLAGKSQAGFSMYRAAGARLGGGSARPGGTPIDPHHLEWLP